MTLEEADVIIDNLLDGWEGALHSADSMWQVLQTIPDWKSKLVAAEQNEFRRQATMERFAPVRLAVRETRAGLSGIEPIRKALATMRKVH